MKHKIVLVGCHSIASELAHRITESNPELNVSITEIVNNPFTRKTTYINSFKDLEIKDINFYDHKPSSYIGKPKNNFKKR